MQGIDPNAFFAKIQYTHNCQEEHNRKQGDQNDIASADKLTISRFEQRCADRTCVHTGSCKTRTDAPREQSA